MFPSLVVGYRRQSQQGRCSNAPLQLKRMHLRFRMTAIDKIEHNSSILPINVQYNWIRAALGGNAGSFQLGGCMSTEQITGMLAAREGDGNVGSTLPREVEVLVVGLGPVGAHIGQGATPQPFCATIAQIGHHGRIQLVNCRRTAAAMTLFLPLLSMAAGAMASQVRFNDNAQNPKIWRTAPTAGRCNVSQAKNIAGQSGLLFLRLVSSDDENVVIEGRTIAGDREVLRFRNVGGCPSYP